MENSTKDSWQQLYKIEPFHSRVEDGDLGSYLKQEWQLKTHEGDVVATYRDYGYAIKHARRKYKKLVRLMEKSLMS